MLVDVAENNSFMLITSISDLHAELVRICLDKISMFLRFGIENSGSARICMSNSTGHVLIRSEFSKDRDKD